MWILKLKVPELTPLFIRVIFCSNVFFLLGSLPPPGTYSTARACILALHQLWATDNALFVRALGDSPNVQRKYIWTTKHLELLKASINLNPWDEAGNILADLMVDYDDNSSCMEQ